MNSQLLLFLRKHFFSPHRPSNCFSIPATVEKKNPTNFPLIGRRAAERPQSVSLFATYILGVSGMPGTQLTGIAVYVGSRSSASSGSWRPAVMKRYTEYPTRPTTTSIPTQRSLKIQNTNPRQSLLKYPGLLGKVHFFKKGNVVMCSG